MTYIKIPLNVFIVMYVIFLITEIISWRADFSNESITYSELQTVRTDECKN